MRIARGSRVEGERMSGYIDMAKLAFWVALAAVLDMAGLESLALVLLVGSIAEYVVRSARG
jgi:hypothetical protein